MALVTVTKKIRKGALIGALPVLLALSFSSVALADPEFPELTGRVVDDANMLSPEAEARIDALLKGHEEKTTNQVVVVTLPDLQGYPIEEYGYLLGRHWGIGQSAKNAQKNDQGETKKDNGVILLVAQEERKVRIEVGYGLEGELTDAISSNIIQTVILPDFRAGRFERGIENGTTSIVQALGGGYQMHATPSPKRHSGGGAGLFAPLAFLVLLLVMSGLGRRRGGMMVYPGGWGGGRGGGFGGGGGGFSGGGGGFGGGGASGGW